jgi:flagellar basal-body rod modification protein FlgD
MSTISPTTSAAAPTAQGSAGSPSLAKANEDMGERFLKLLMVQIQNQDPMNPLDNAQLTTQMAQINTVGGIEKMNDSMTKMLTRLSALDNLAGLSGLQGSIQDLSGQMRQSQTVQAAGLVGRDVLVAGNALQVRDGVARGSFDLGSSASAVAVDVLGPAGRVLGQVDLGARAKGRADFSWSVPQGVSAEGLTYRVRATAGTAAVKADLYAADVVKSVSTGSGGAVVQLLRGGTTPLAQIQTFN